MSKTFKVKKVVEPDPMLSRRMNTLATQFQIDEQTKRKEAKILHTEQMIPSILRTIHEKAASGHTEMVSYDSMTGADPDYLMKRLTEDYGFYCDVDDYGYNVLIKWEKEEEPHKGNRSFPGHS